MSACSFSIGFTEGADEIVTRAKNSITKAGGKFEGDTLAGSVEMQTPIGPVQGSYTITGQTLNVNITTKPAFVPCSLIESELKKRIT